MTFKTYIEQEAKKDYYIKLKSIIQNEYSKYTCYPPYGKIFHALSVAPLSQVKVVILGQDPYHGPNQAHGLAFSVLCAKIPPSLQNIYKEMATDLNRTIQQDGNLDYLARQGVLLLNTILTVRSATPLSHKGLGWEIFTDGIIDLLNNEERPIVFILWGANAIAKKKRLTNPNHLVLTSVHPSPLSAYGGFYGSKPFSKANLFLKQHGVTEIKWVKEDTL